MPARGGRRLPTDSTTSRRGRWSDDPLALPNVRGQPLRLRPRRPDIHADIEAARAWVRNLNGSLRAIDLFSGCGGLGLGLERAGIRVVAAADADPVALSTYAANLDSLVWCGDLAEPDEFLAFLEERGVQSVDVVAGGPPCQPFSRAGMSKIRSLVAEGARPAKDSRVDLWRSFTAVVDRLAPRAVILENVPDMAGWSDGSVLLGVMQSLSDRGYVSEARVLQAERHGVPQHRQRLFVVARRRGTFSWPRPSRTRVDLEAAIGDLPVVEAGSHQTELPYDGPGSDFQMRARRGMPRESTSIVHDHVTRAVRSDDAEAFALLRPGQTYRDLPTRLKRYRDDIFDDKYKRLAWDDVSRTITAHIARDGYWYIHPEQHRTLSIREAARIQTFPDIFRFCGHPSVQLRQIGNAVPPALGEAVSRRVVSALQSSEPVRRSTFGDTLRTWLRHRGGPLPAPGGQHTAWAVLISELCIARQAAAVRQRRLRAVLDIAPSPHAAVRHAEALTEILGARTAQRLVDAAEAVIVRHGGSVPCDEFLLRGLPGVGAHAAAAIRSFGFGERTVPANHGVRRVVGRVTGLTVSSVWTSRLELLRLAGPDGPDVVFNAGLQRLAEEICAPAAPLCEHCPVVAECRMGHRRMQYHRARQSDSQAACPPTAVAMGAD